MDRCKVKSFALQPSLYQNGDVFCFSCTFPILVSRMIFPNMSWEVVLETIRAKSHQNARLPDIGRCKIKSFALQPSLQPTYLFQHCVFPKLSFVKICFPKLISSNSVCTKPLFYQNMFFFTSWPMVHVMVHNTYVQIYIMWCGGYCWWVEGVQNAYELVVPKYIFHQNCFPQSVFTK